MAPSPASMQDMIPDTEVLDLVELPSCHTMLRKKPTEMSRSCCKDGRSQSVSSMVNSTGELDPEWTKRRGTRTQVKSP